MLITRLTKPENSLPEAKLEKEIVIGNLRFRVISYKIRDERHKGLNIICVGNETGLWFSMIPDDAIRAIEEWANSTV